MKIVTIPLLLILTTSLTAQDKIIGRYRDYFGSRIELHSDSTFKYTWHFDLLSSWTKGTWTILKDTIFFQMRPIYDTSRLTNSINLTIDTLILSVDEKPERISKVDTSVLLSYGQNFQTYPKKLFFRKGRLYKIQGRSLLKKKQKGFWTSKKWTPWYFKSDD